MLPEDRQELQLLAVRQGQVRHLARIRREHPGALVSLCDLDLASLPSVATLGHELRAEALPIHLLVNNTA